LRLPISSLRLAALWPALAALATAGVLLGALLPGLIREGAAAELSQTVTVLMPAAPASSGSDDNRLQEWAVATVRGTNLRLTWIDSAGRVLADSDRTSVEIAAMENHADRPEVQAAMATGSGSHVRRSETTGVPYVYAARSLGLPGGGVAVLRQAQPFQGLSAVVGRVFLALALAAATSLAVLGAVSWWLTLRIFRPLGLVMAGAERLAAGDYRQRLALPPQVEVASPASAVNRLAERIGGQIAGTQTERDQLRTILASMSDGVLVTSSEGRTLLANDALRHLFRLTGEVVGALPLELSRQPILSQLVHSTIADAEKHSGTIEIEAPERRTLALTSAPLRHVDGSRGAVVVARDISAFTRLAESRRDFVANVSHELKTPLAAIRGFAETLRDGALDEPATARRFTDRILRQCARLQALLDDLLTLSRLESVADPLTDDGVDLGELVRKSLDEWAAAASLRGLTFTHQLATVPPVAGNANALERLLGNLIENALKYNRAGGHVGVRLRRRGDADAGILDLQHRAVAAAALPRVFERFYRVDQGRARDEGGTGLGLAIVKHVAQSHGGSVEVESELGRGATFRVELPLRPPAGHPT
jgi:two-component system, OmpR family, phosphate regulon sensor histidine kinase PhoR